MTRPILDRNGLELRTGISVLVERPDEKIRGTIIAISGEGKDAELMIVTPKNVTLFSSPNSVIRV